MLNHFRICISDIALIEGDAFLIAQEVVFVLVDLNTAMITSSISFLLSFSKILFLFFSCRVNCDASPSLCVLAKLYIFSLLWNLRFSLGQMSMGSMALTLALRFLMEWRRELYMRRLIALEVLSCSINRNINLPYYRICSQLCILVREYQ